MKHITPGTTNRVFLGVLWTYLACILLVAALAAGGCAKNFYRPDGTLEHTEQLDPQAVALIGQAIEVAAQIAVAESPSEVEAANDNARTFEEVLIDQLPPETQDAASRAIQAAQDDDWAALIEAVADLREAQQKLGGE